MRAHVRPDSDSYRRSTQSGLPSVGSGPPQKRRFCVRCGRSCSNLRPSCGLLGRTACWCSTRICADPRRNRPDHPSKCVVLTRLGPRASAVHSQRGRAAGPGGASRSHCHEPRRPALGTLRLRARRLGRTGSSHPRTHSSSGRDGCSRTRLGVRPRRASTRSRRRCVRPVARNACTHSHSHRTGACRSHGARAAARTARHSHARRRHAGRRDAMRAVTRKGTPQTAPNLRHCPMKERAQHGRRAHRTPLLNRGHG